MIKLSLPVRVRVRLACLKWRMLFKICIAHLCWDRSRANRMHKQARHQIAGNFTRSNQWQLKTLHATELDAHAHIVFPGLRYLICGSQVPNFLSVKRARGSSKAKCFKIMKYSPPVVLQTTKKFLNPFISLRRITFCAGLIV